MAAGTSWALARAHQKTTPYAVVPSPLREATPCSRPEKMPGGWPFALGPLFFFGAGGLYAWLFWDDLPPRIAVHWGLHGADRWVERTPSSVFFFLVLFASLYAGMLLVSYGILRWSRTISVTGESARGESLFRRGTILLLLGVQYLVVIPAVVFAFRPETAAPWVFVPAVLLVAIVAIVALTRLGQGGSSMADPSEYQPPVGDHTPDAAWKWGLIYYNPDDPALIVEKRYGLGYTFNFANPWAWALLALLLVPAVLAVILTRHYS
jgi:uncharacterized membrane protein